MRGFYWTQSRSSSQAIWMASRIFSLLFAGSSAKPGSSRTHLCRSVKRTESGSVSGNLSCSARPISRTSSQLSFWAMFDLAATGPIVGLAASWPPSFGRPRSRGLRLVALLGMLVVPGVLRLLGDVVDDVLPGQPRLAAEAPVRLPASGPPPVPPPPPLPALQSLEPLLHP